VPTTFIVHRLGSHAGDVPSNKSDSTATAVAQQASPPVQRPASTIDSTARAPAAVRVRDPMRQPAVVPRPAQTGTKHPTPLAARPSALTNSRPADTATRAAPPPAPLPASLEIRGELPAGTTITVVDSGGQTRTVSGRSIQLAAGNYGLQFSAPGYENDRQEIRLGAGESQSWTPSMREVAKARTAVTPPTSTVPAHDRAADIDAIEAAIRAFVAAFDGRDGRTVLPLMPSEGRDGWQQLLESGDVRDLHARLDRISQPNIDGDGALVDFRMHLSYRNFNQYIQQDMDYKATVTRGGAGWRLSFVQPKR
jgi:hypothetical protein